MKIIAANWKMNKTRAEAKSFLDDLKKLVPQEPKNRVIICAPFTSLDVVKNGPAFVELGAQNFHPAPNGTFTGEISLSMLKEAGVKVVLTGHSERRTIFNESDAFINQKTKTAIEQGFITIFCFGESFEEYTAAKTSEVIKRQLTEGLAGVTDCKNLIVAYEPVWAISGGDPNKPKPIPTREIIEQIHGEVKRILAKQFNGADIPVLYGGSANDKNCVDLHTIKGVDGYLIGGASLVAEKYATMINYNG